LKVVGAELGVSYTYISKIENGVVVPSPELLQRLAIYYKAEPDQLFRRADRLPPDVAAIVKNNREQVVELLRKHFPVLESG
jgi:transcriptional regulator with XRE-family HTH domain